MTRGSYGVNPHPFLSSCSFHMHSVSLLHMLMVPMASNILENPLFPEWIFYVTLVKSHFSFLICKLGIILLEWIEAKITNVCNLCWYSSKGGRHNGSANKLLWLFSISVNGKALQSRVQSKYNRMENYMCRVKKNNRKARGRNFIAVVLVINEICTFIFQYVL